MLRRTLDGGEIEQLIRDLFLRGDTSIPVSHELDLLAAGICDSLGLVQLAAALEARVPSLRIRDSEVRRDTLGSISKIEAFLVKASPE